MTVAHIMANLGYIFPDDHPVIHVKDVYGYSVGYLMISNGYKFHIDHPILKTKQEDGVPLVFFQIQHTKRNYGGNHADFPAACFNGSYREDASILHLTHDGVNVGKLIKEISKNIKAFLESNENNVG